MRGRKTIEQCCGGQMRLQREINCWICGITLIDSKLWMPQMSSFEIMMVLVNSQQQTQPAGCLCACVCVQESEVIPTISRAPNAHRRVSAYVARDREGEEGFSGASVRCWAEGKVKKRKPSQWGYHYYHVMSCLQIHGLALAPARSCP